MTRAMRHLLGLAALLVSGCATLDISHESAVDFERYRTVAVSVESSVGSDADATSYLVSELNDVSAFKKAVPSGVQADLLLHVSVSAYPVQDDDDFLKYVADAHYVVTTPQGETLLDETLSDESTLSSEAMEDALDEVARVFIPPYDY